MIKWRLRSAAADIGLCSSELTTLNNPTVDLKELFKYREIGFKLVPLGNDGTPTMSWTPIYDDPNYWMFEKLAEESQKFFGVATVFGRSPSNDSEGKDLYLNELDIDSNNVYQILFRLQTGDGPEYSLIPLLQKETFVIKTKKPNGFRISWLSHQQNKPIHTSDCKPGYKFEIKTDKSSGHSTLPPSSHRDDPNFHYMNIGQEKLGVCDELYDKLVKTLGDCLKANSAEETGSGASRRSHHDHSSNNYSEIDNENINIICKVLSPCYKKGHRNALVFALSGLIRKSGVSYESALNIIQTLAKDDEERKSRITTLEMAYKRDPAEVCGVRYFLQTFESLTPNANKILDEILGIIGKGIDPVQRLTSSIMNEYIFKTMTDTGEIYYYDGQKYVPGGEWKINELAESMRPEIKTNQRQEIINHIKYRRGIHRSLFDADPDFLNLQNGLLNIRTGEFKEHSPEHFSLVQLSIKYDPRAKCPAILRFLGQVLKPKDVFTALELIGYCLYKTAIYEKATLLVGKGANGKGTFLKLIEHFLGQENVSHVSLQDMVGDRFAVADLYGKLANTFADLKTDKLKSTGNFKMLVSGDFIRAQKKFRDPFDFKNYAKLIFSANEIPQSDDKTYAFFRRWIILFFERVFEGENYDAKLIDKLTTEEEKSGLLNLALIALRQLIKDKGFIHIDDIATVERDYNLNASTVQRFVNEKCEITNDQDDFIICRDLWGVYLKYCKHNGLSSKDDNKFGMELKQLHIDRRQLRIGKAEREYCYLGIKLKDSSK
jgi:P4 family phage/plasmid primase-like protien